jgi:hypothetical protein
MPIIGKEAEDDMRSEMSDMMGIPYYPGKEQLWVGGGLAKAEVDERELVHPVAEGSEAYYHYETGDSVIMTLPDFQHAVCIELVTQRAQELDDRGGVAAPAFTQVFVLAGVLVHRAPSRDGSPAVGFNSYTDEKSTSRAT